MYPNYCELLVLSMLTIHLTYLNTRTHSNLKKLFLTVVYFYNNHDLNEIFIKKKCMVLTKSYTYKIFITYDNLHIIVYNAFHKNHYNTRNDLSRSKI